MRAALPIPAISPYRKGHLNETTGGSTKPPRTKKKSLKREELWFAAPSMISTMPIGWLSKEERGRWRNRRLSRGDFDRKKSPSRRVKLLCKYSIHDD